MQVSHVADHVTHAFIGGKQTIDFGISSSAEFFNILSSTLYSDQRLAVIREVLCNAWDAHIASNRTHIPVQVLFEDNKFTIRDFGHGIHHDQIGPIYGTYGASTKQNDGKQTGGFGLGCKAPFAYTDHFQVVSHHEGVMTIYAMSKSLSEVMGLPGITAIMQAPTQQSGISVQIQIKNSTDYSTFQRLVHRIASEGDMNVTINDEPADKLNFNTDDGQYYIIDNSTNLRHKIGVRYGNVVYPVANHPDIDKYHTEILKLFSEQFKNNHVHILFQAPPHSISVTPSRESLSMQEHTIATLKKLYTQFIKEFKNHFEPGIYDATKGIYQRAHKSNNINITKWLSRNMTGVNETSYYNEYEGNVSKIQCIEDLAVNYVKRNYLSTFQYRLFDLEQRLGILVSKNLVDERLAVSFLEYFKKSDPKKFNGYVNSRHHHTQAFNEYASDWFYQVYAKKLIRSISNSSDVSINNLYVSDLNVNYTFDEYNDWQKKNKFKNLPLQPIRQVTFSNQNEMLPYLRNIVVLATARSHAKEGGTLSDGTVSVKPGSGFLFYHSGSKKTDIEATRRFWATTGMYVIDLLDTPVREKSLGIPTPPKPKRKGYTRLDMVYRHNRIDKDWIGSDSSIFIEDPAFYVKTDNRKDMKHSIEYFPNNLKGFFMKYFGDKGCIITTSRQEEALIKKGIPEFKTYAAKAIMEYIEFSPSIAAEWVFDSTRIVNEHGKGHHADATQDAMELICDIPELRLEFGLLNSYTETDKHYLYMLDAFINETYQYDDDHKAMCKFRADMQTIPLDPQCNVVIDVVLKSNSIGYLDVSKLKDDYRAEKDDPIKRAKFVQIFLSILKL